MREVDLAEPEAGEVLVRLVACGVCHTDLYTASGADPSGYVRAVLGHEGAGVVERVGQGVASVAPGDHVVTLFSPQCRECVHCRQRPHEPVPRDPRTAEPRFPARRDDAPLRRRRAAPPLHGHLDLRRVHRDAGDRAGEGRSGGAARRRGALRVRPLDRDRRSDQHGEGGAGLDVRRLRRRHGRARRGDRLPAAGRGADRLRRPVGGAARARGRPRRDRDDARRRRRRRADRWRRRAASAPITPSRRRATCR